MSGQSSEVMEELIRLNSTMKSILEEQKRQTEHLTHIDKVVRLGNGRPPLTERVAMLEDSARDQSKKIDENKGFIVKALGTFGIAVTGLVGAATKFFNAG